MRAERIGHGYHAYDDPEVYAKVIREHIHLETCPISSILTKACDSDVTKHPLRKYVFVARRVELTVLRIQTMPNC